MCYNIFIKFKEETNMTKKEFDNMSFDEVFEWANENINDLTTEDTLIDFAKTKIDDDNLMMALHVLEAVHNNPYDTEIYLYDYSMGTLETPTPVTCKEDLEDYIDFDDEEDPYDHDDEVNYESRLRCR